MEANERGATLVPPGEGKKLWVTDELVTFKAPGEDTGGAYSLTDSTVPPQGGPPPHVHHREDEAFPNWRGNWRSRRVRTGSRRAPGPSYTFPKASSTPTGTSAPGTPGS